MFNQFNELNLLYVEDNDVLRVEYLKTFELIFGNTYSASNFDDALELYSSIRPDLLLIDIELKMSKSGFDIADKIREIDAYTPIIFLTSYSDSEYILKAINSNINGYIIKPLNLPKLIEVIERCFFEKEDKSVIKISNELSYNFDTFELTKNNQIISLGRKENTLLSFLLKNRNKTLKREIIEHEIWNDSFVSDSALKNLIAVLRKKLGKEKIINISGLGWRINID